MPPTIAVFINPGHDKSKPQPEQQVLQSQLRIRQPGRSLRPLSAGRNHSGSRDSVTTSRTIPRCAPSAVPVPARSVRSRRPGNGPMLPQGLFQRRQLHQSARRQRLSGAGSQDGTETDSRLHGRHQRRRRQRLRQLAVGQSADGVGAEVHGLRHSLRLGRGLRSQRRLRRFSISRRHEVAVAKGSSTSPCSTPAAISAAT